MKQKSAGNNPSRSIQYWVLNGISKVSARCYSDYGSSSILLSLKFFETTITGSIWLDNCLSHMEKLIFLFFFHDVIHLNNEWNKSRMAIIIQRWYDIDSKIKYLKSWMEVIPMLALHRFYEFKSRRLLQL